SSVLSEHVRPGDAAIPGALAEHDAGATPAEREAVAVPPAPATGTLLVHVIWEDDKKPAPGVSVSLDRDGADPLFDVPSATSDDQGAIRFAGLLPGRVHMHVERGGMNWSDAIQVVAGEATESTFEVEAGMDCKGLVVDDEGGPIADAEVLVAP